VAGFGFKRTPNVFFSGLMFGLAFMMKQPGLCFGLFGIFVLIARAVRERSVFTRDFTSTLAAFGGGMVLPFAFFCLSTVVAGDFWRFWFWTFDYAGSYAATRSLSEGVQSFDVYAVKQFPVYGGFMILAGAGLVVALRKPKFRLELFFALAFLFFSFAGTTPGFYFREHYFVLLLPAGAILVGMAVAFLQSGVSQKIKTMPLLLFVGVCCWSIHLQGWVFFKSTPLGLCQFIYGRNPFIESLPVAQYIREHSKPDDRVAVLGSEPQIYFYANRHSATGYIYTYPLMESQHYEIAMQHEMINEIEVAKPVFVVLVIYKYSWLMDKRSDFTIMHWLADYTGKFYEPVGVIGRQADGQTVWIPAKAVNGFNDALQEYMVVYQRKPDAN
jgi:hypothetical protein